MISHVVLHYNRPWLLRTHIELIKKYCPSVSQIIIADDGSDAEVLNYISNIDADIVYVQPDHKFEWKESSASNTIRAALSKCKGTFISFSEDDFFLWPNGIDDNSFYENGTYPDAKLEDGPDALSDAVFLFNVQQAVIVQPSRDHCGWKGVPVTGKTRSNALKWHQIDHRKKTRFYYSNWPWVMKSNNARFLSLPKSAGMWKVESHLNKWMTDNYGKGNWNWCADKRLFVHVGLPFSKKDMRYAEKTEKASIRNEQSKAFVTSIGKEEEFSTIDDFNRKFLEKWLINKPEIKIEDLKTIGLRLTFEKFAQEVMN